MVASVYCALRLLGVVDVIVVVVVVALVTPGEV